MSKPTAICLMGPTASGKTAIACNLYHSGRFELISVDSALIYKGLDIGTAKPSAAELQRYPHHLVDIMAPNEVYSAAQFVADANRMMHEIVARGKTPLLVGGTLLYFNSLLHGMADMPAADAAVRQEIEEEAAEKGWESIHAQLAAVDPRAAQRFKATDKQRLLRALEVYRISGQSISSFHDAQTTQESAFHFTSYALMPERAWLHNNIALRLDAMWHAGFVDEVRQLRQNAALTVEMPSMRCVGYRQVWEYLDWVETASYAALTTAEKQAYFKSMQDKCLFATRQLAKRQYTWLRKLQSKGAVHSVDLNTVTTHILNNI